MCGAGQFTIGARESIVPPMDTPTVTVPPTTVLPHDDPSPSIGPGASADRGRAVADRGAAARLRGLATPSFLRPRIQVEAASDQALITADDVVWGFVVKEGYDELDDPWYHRGLTQHAYKEGDDFEALCGFRPPLYGSRGRRRPRLALPTSGIHPMCNVCAKRIAPPRQRVALSVTPQRPAVAVPMGGRTPAPAPAMAAMAAAPRVRRAS